MKQSENKNISTVVSIIKIKKMTHILGLMLLTSLLITKSICEDNVATGCARWYDVPPSKLVLACPLGHVVSVTKAFYGYWAKNKGGVCSYSRADCTEDAMHVAVDACRSKTRCEVPVTTPLVAHVLASALDMHSECASWNDRHDYLQVYYKCTEVPSDFVFTASKCTHFYTINEEAPHPVLTEVFSPLRNELAITCPPDKVITINESFYGWWKDNSNRGCRFHTEDCRVDSAEAAARCNGRQSCVLSVDRSGTHPSCGTQPFFALKVDKFDYLQVDYQCKPERK